MKNTQCLTKLLEVNIYIDNVSKPHKLDIHYRHYDRGVFFQNIIYIAYVTCLFSQFTSSFKMLEVKSYIFSIVFFEFL